MLLPTFFRSVEEDYYHLKQHVQLWDVACERQIEVSGPDAQALLQLVIPRDLSKLRAGQCIYTPIVDQDGMVLNDPLTIKLDDERFWVSIADSDIGLLLKGLALGSQMRARVHEPDVSPLAVQGPKAVLLMQRLFGAEIANLKFFRAKQFEFRNHDLWISRSGYSKQGGYEIYLTPASLGEALWDDLMNAGQDLEVRAGCPNLIERIEGGLLSYGNDMTSANTLAECTLDKYFDIDEAPLCIGYAALKREQLDGGPARQVRMLRIDGDRVPACIDPWPLYTPSAPAGQVTSAAWSPDLGENVAIGMVEAAYWDLGRVLNLSCADGSRRTATVKGLV